MILAATGHRPNKLNNEYDLKGPLTKAIVSEVYKYIDLLRPTKMITGMALGFDMMVAICAIRQNIPFIASIPFIGQEKMWPRASQSLYNRILENKLAESIIVCEGQYESWKMHQRDKWMVDKGDEILACWNGTKGGTSYTVEYAEKVGKKINRINPAELIW